LMRNEEGIHVGCFLHYKPRSMHAKDSAKWDDVARVARKNQRDHQINVQYHATPTVEPKNPVFTSINYGEGSKSRDAEQSVGNGSFQATFINDARYTVDIFWVSEEGDKVAQGQLDAGTRMHLNTFRGHRFIVAKEGSQEALEHFKANPARKEYRFTPAE